MTEVNELECVEVDVCGDSNALDTPISNDEIVSAITHLKKGKAAGPDDIQAEMLKDCIDIILPLLSILFNTIFERGEFPSSWHKSVVIPLHRYGSYDTPDSYRGISLLSILSKVFTHVISKWLQKWADSFDLILEEQAGFRSGYTSSDNIFVLNSAVQKYLMRKKGLFVAFVDFRKAFDSVNRASLWEILKNNGIQGKMLRILRAMYSAVKSCVRYDGAYSKYFVPEV